MNKSIRAELKKSPMKLLALSYVTSTILGVLIGFLIFFPEELGAKFLATLISAPFIQILPLIVILEVMEEPSTLIPFSLFLLFCFDIYYFLKSKNKIPFYIFTIGIFLISTVIPKIFIYGMSV